MNICPICHSPYCDMCMKPYEEERERKRQKAEKEARETEELFRNALLKEVVRIKKILDENGISY